MRSVWAILLLTALSGLQASLDDSKDAACQLAEAKCGDPGDANSMLQFQQGLEAVVAKDAQSRVAANIIDKCIAPVMQESCPKDKCGQFEGFEYAICCISDALQSQPHTSVYPLDKNMTQESDARCPQKLLPPMKCLMEELVQTYQENSLAAMVLKLVGLKAHGTPILSKNVVELYTVAFYLMAQLGSKQRMARYNDSVRVPTRYNMSVETLTVGYITVPVADIDDLTTDDPPDALPNRVLNDQVICAAGPALTTIPHEDWVEDDTRNTWALALAGWCRSKKGKMGKSMKKRWEYMNCMSQRKEEWVLSLWASYEQQDGINLWPARDTNFAAHFWRKGMWEDGLEEAMAFSSIGTHRVALSDREFGGERLPYFVGLKEYAKMATRSGLGRYGADMYFTETGVPALIVTPDGKEVTRGSRDWQYWKFVWRSTLFSIITMVDHLHMSHFKIANNLAKGVRDTLPPDHPGRRFFTIFTFQSIGINYNSMFLLTPEKGALDRATPFDSFGGVSMIVCETLPDISDMVKYFASDELRQELPAKLQNAPFYADGLLLYNALAKMVEAFMNIYKSEWCDPQTDVVIDPHIQRMVARLASMYKDAAYQGKFGEYKTCKRTAFRVTAVLYTVTAFHRHVGQVGGLASDPDLVAFSWKDGERFSRPIDALLMANIAAFTSNPQPKLLEEYDHVFAGMEKETEAVAVFKEFRQDLLEVERIIRSRNEQRAIKYTRAAPSSVEISVAI